MMFNFPFRVLIEKSVEGKINGLLLEANLGKKCLIFADDHIMKIVGGKIRETISGSFKVHVINPESSDAGYLKGVAKRLAGFDFSIAIGGGRTIDAAKYSSFLAKKPWIAFPTVLSHDGVVSSRASIGSSGTKISVAASGPAAIVADLNTIRKAPYRFLASGCGDLISNISAVNDWRLAAEAGKEKYSVLIAELSLLSAKACIRHAKEILSKSYSGLEALLWGLICSGFAMNLHGSSRPCSGSEHNFSHALEMLGSSALHGEQVALGTIISLCLQKEDWENARKVIKKFGLPTTAKELGIKEEMAVKALSIAKNIRDRYTVLNRYKLTEKGCRKVLEETGVI